MTKNMIFSVLIGAALLMGWHFLMDMNWTRQGSLDVVAGAILDFFIFTYLLSESEKKQEQKVVEQQAAHLDKIEQLIKRVYANQKDGDTND